MFVGHTLTTFENTEVNKVSYSQNPEYTDSFEHKNKLVILFPLILIS